MVAGGREDWMKNWARILAGGLLVAVLGGVSACSNDEVVGPQIGSLEVILGMTGADLDTNGGTLLLDDDVVGILAVNVKLSIDEIESGVYVIEVIGIAPNCTILGDNPRNVRIRAGQTSVEDFNFLCESTGGKDPGDGDGPVVD
jgi:hypothetical protein